MPTDTQTPATGAPVSNVTPGATPNPATGATPEQKIVSITINGKKVAFTAITNPRAKGDDKGAPLLQLKFVGTDPTLGDILPVVATIGETAFAKVAVHEILRPLFFEATKAARYKDANGVWGIDAGKFAAATITLINEYTQTTSERARLEAERDDLAEQITKTASAMLKAMMTGTTFSDAERNAANQLILRKADIDQKLKKKEKKTAAAATQAAASQAAVAAPVA